jgi:hypothetical protein
MPFVPIPSTIRVEVVYSWDGQICENVFHVSTPNAINEAELDAVQEIFKDWYETYLSTTQSQTVSLVKYIVLDASDQYGVAKEYPPGLVYQGSISTTPSLPNNVTFALRWNTGLRGRSFRGRTYHVGLVEGLVTQNAVNNDSLVSIVGSYGELLDMLDASSRSLVVASKFQGNAPRTTGLATPIVTVTADGVIDSQRRRLPGRGS